MNARMARDARAYRNTLLIFWVALPATAVWYSNQQNIPPGMAAWFVAAGMIELAFYLAPGFAWSRGQIEAVKPAPVRAFALMLSAVAPYLVYSFGTSTLHWRNFALLALLTTVSAAWYVVLPGKKLWVDLLFIALFATVWLSGAFEPIYITLTKRLPAFILGQLMWIRLTILSVLTIRKMGGIGFGFLPTKRDWMIGIVTCALFAPVAVALGVAIRFATPHTLTGPWWRTAGLVIITFAGMLWVTALIEEFLARGMLQQILAKRFGTLPALIVASLCFGLVHLPFRHQFPNWKFFLIASVAGLFYGIAYLRAGSIRAAMVTHALMVTVWRVFFD